VRVDGGSSVERLVCHPRLPLVAGLDSSRPAVHVWDSAGLRKAGTVGAESAVYGDAEGWQRRKRIPAVAWHPDQPLLLVAVEGTVMQWTPAGLSELEGIPASYLSLAFSPDGRTLWASPSSGEGDDAWERSDVIDLATGTVDTGPGWDTGVATHPAGGLVVTLNSDQGATHGLFARADHKMRVLRRALILDADGYRTPIFSPDGRHLAIRGNSYENSLEVFEFPSLRRVLATTLGEPAPDYPYPDEWYEQFEAWSPHNIAFGSQPGVIWVGTPAGTLVEVDIDSQAAAEHDVLAGSKVTGLAATATGELIVAGGDGELVLVSGGSATTTASRDTVTAFLGTTSEVPDEGRLETHLVVTDGTRAWHKDDLASVTTADETDPGWLRLQAAINNATRGETGPAEG
jgi:WD40 repeat protein